MRATGNETRRLIFEAGCELLREHGLHVLSMRATAARARVSYGAVQCQFSDPHQLTVDVLRWWGASISRELKDASDGSSGLARVWDLCSFWVKHEVCRLLGISGTTLRTPSGKRASARSALLELLQGWIDETVRALKQARLQRELKDGTHVEAIALDVHRLLWSHSWSSALCGEAASASAILAAVRTLLLNVASDSTKVPAVPSVESVTPSRPPLPRPYDPREPDWKWLLEPGDPLYQALSRHELMGDPRHLGEPLEILPEDLAEAKKHPRPSHLDENYQELPSRNAPGYGEDDAPSGSGP